MYLSFAFRSRSICAVVPVACAFAILLHTMSNVIRADDAEPAFLQAHTKPVTALGFTSDSKHLITASEDGTLRMWDVDKKASSVLAQGQIPFRSLAISKDGSVFTGNDAGQLEIRDLASPKRGTRTILAHANWTTVTKPQGNVVSDALSRYPVVAVAVSHDGKMVASGATDGTVALWKTDSGRELGRLKGHAAAVAGLSFSPDGLLLASGSSDRTIRLWDPLSGREVSSLRRRQRDEWDAGVSALTFEPSGKRILSTGRMAELFGDYSIRSWLVSDGQETSAFQLPDGAGSCIAISADGSICVIGTWNGAVYLFATKSWEVLDKVRAWNLDESSALTCVAVSADGRFIAAGGIGNDVSIIRWK